MGKKILMPHPLQPIVDVTCNVLNRLKAVPGTGFLNFPCPICWFGDIDSEKPKIFTFGINPSDIEFTARPPHLQVKAGNLIQAYNDYFKINPYKEWFRSYNTLLLQNLNASYYDGNAEYQLIHIDIFPFATNPVWSNLSNAQKLLIPNGNNLISALIKYCNPKLIISFGEQPYKMNALIQSSGNPIWYKPIMPSQKSPAGVKKARSISHGYLCTSSGKAIPMINSTMVLAFPGPGYNGHMQQLISIANQIKLP